MGNNISVQKQLQRCSKCTKMYGWEQFTMKYGLQNKHCYSCRQHDKNYSKLYF